MESVLERSKAVLDKVEQTMSPSTFRHRRVVSTVPAMAHGVPETIQTKRDAEERIKKMEKFSSANYDYPESDLHRAADLNRGEFDYNSEEVWRWVIAVLIGIAMGFVAFHVNWGIDALNALKYGATKRAIASSGGFWGPYFVYMVFCLMYAAAASAIVSFIEPLAAGSGIPEIKTYLNGVHIRGLLAVRTFFAKMVGMMFTISSGLVAGKVGPFVHGGGIVGGGIGQMGSLFFSKRTGKRFAAARHNGGYFRNEYDHRDFVAVGSGAGIATAFGAPIGGLLFTIEESASFYSASIFWRGFLATCLGTTVVNILEGVKPSQITSVFSHKVGISRDFGPYNEDSGKYVFYFYLWETPFFILLGILGGLFAALFIRVNVHILKWRQVNIPPTNPKKRVYEVIFICFVTQSLWYLITYASHCAAVPETVIGTTQAVHYPQLWCPDGKYKPYGQLFFTSLANGLRLMCHFDDFEFGAVFLYFVLVMAFMTWTFGVGAATGLFITSLVAGASMGRCYGRMLQSFLTACGYSGKISLQGYAVIGAASMLSGTTRMTLSISVLVMESTGALSMIVPIMTAVFFAKLIGDHICLSVHDTQIRIRGAPVLLEPALRHHQKMVTLKLTAADVMANKVFTLPPIIRVRDLIDLLKASNHEVFPVAWEAEKTSGGHSLPFEVLGVIERHTVLRLLKHRIGLFTPSPGHPEPYDVRQEAEAGRVAPPSYTQEQRLKVLEELEQYPMKLRPLEDQSEVFRGLPLVEQETSYLDMRTYMQKNPYTVSADSTLFRAYRLFRTMGLRYLLVTPSHPQVIGILTRKDLTEEKSQLTLLNKALSRGILHEGFLEDDEELDIGREMVRFWKDVVKEPLSRLPFIDYLEAGLSVMRRGDREDSGVIRRQFRQETDARFQAEIRINHESLADDGKEASARLNNLGPLGERGAGPGPAAPAAPPAPRAPPAALDLGDPHTPPRTPLATGSGSSDMDREGSVIIRDLSENATPGSVGALLYGIGGGSIGGGLNGAAAAYADDKSRPEDPFRAEQEAQERNMELAEVAAGRAAAPRGGEVEMQSVNLR